LIALRQSPSKPPAHQLHGFGKGPSSRADNVQDQSGRGIRTQAANDRIDDVIEMN